MAATTTPLNGSLYRLAISTDAGTTYDVVALTTSLSLSRQMGERITNSRDDCGSETSQPNGRKVSSLSGSGFLNFNVEAGKLKSNDVVDLFDAGTTFFWYLEPYDCTASDTKVGEYNWKGSGYFTEFSPDFTMDDNATISWSIKATGEVTHAVEV